MNGNALYYHAKKWGPSIRTCIKLEQDPMVANSLISQASLAASTFFHIFKGGDGLNIKGLPGFLLAIRPKGLEAHQRVTIVAEISTSYLHQIIVQEITASPCNWQTGFYGIINKHPSFTSLARNIFKIYFYAWVLCRCQLKLPTPYISPTGLDIGSDLQVIPACKEVCWITGSSFLKNASRFKIPFGWLPITKAFSPIDAIICTDQHIVTIQTSVSAIQCVRLEVLKDIKENFPQAFQAKRTWCHVIVTDDGDRAKNLQIQGLKALTENNVSIYSTVLNIHHDQLHSLERKIIYAEQVTRGFY